MLIRTLVLAAILLLPAIAEAATPWRYFGRERFTDSCEVGLGLIPLDEAEIKRQICAKREKVTVDVVTFNQYVDADGSLSASAGRSLKQRALFYTKGRMFLENMSAIGAPPSLVTKIEKEKIDAATLTKTRGTTKIGDKCDWMVRTDPKDGQHKLTEEIQVAPAPDAFDEKEIHPAYLGADKKSLVAYTFTAETPHHKVTALEPAVCHNLCLKDYPQALIRSQVQAPPPPPPPPLPTPPPAQPLSLLARPTTAPIGRWIYITIYNWVGKEAAAVAKGKTSREIDHLVFDKMSQPKFPLLKECADQSTLELVGLSSAKAQGKTLLWNGKPVIVDMDMNKNHVVPVCGDGRGSIAVGPDWREWIPERGSGVIFRPDPRLLPRLVSPDNETPFVASCTGQNNVQCKMTWSESVSELYKALDFVEKQGLTRVRIHGVFSE